MKGVLSVAAVSGRIGERTHDLEHLDDRPGPAVRDHQRQGILVTRPNVNEVNAKAIDLGVELWEAI